MSSTSTLSGDSRGVIVPCAQCGQANRVAYARLDQTGGHCAKCKAALPPVAQPVEASDAASFRAMIAQAPIPVLVDFWAPWCGPCQMVAPEVANLARTAAGEFLVAKVNTEDLPEIGAAFRIRSIPTFAVFAGGEERGRTSGALPAPQLRAFVRQTAGAGRAV